MAPNLITARDTLDEGTASLLAYELTSFWRAKGLTTALFYVEPVSIVSHDGRRRIYIVRSNLVNGVPPRFAA